jgi:hypothetical protein
MRGRLSYYYNFRKSYNNYDCRSRCESDYPITITSEKVIITMTGDQRIALTLCLQLALWSLSYVLPLFDERFLDDCSMNAFSTTVRWTLYLLLSGSSLWLLKIALRRVGIERLLVITCWEFVSIAVRVTLLSLEPPCSHYISITQLKRLPNITCWKLYLVSVWVVAVSESRLDH